MIRCIACGRILLRAAATVTLGPACARKAMLLPQPVPRIFTVARRRRASAQMELVG